MKRGDWLPSNRNDQLAMGVNWYKGVSLNADKWGVPEPMRVKLSAALDVAKGENAIPQSERNPVTNARLKTAFDELTAVMRDMKKRYFYNPPLTDADILSLGLKLKDKEPTPVNDPVGEPEVKIILTRRAQLTVQIVPDETVQEDKRTNYGCRIYYGVYAAGETPPESGMDLRQSLFTRRKKELFTFLPTDTGKTAYFSIRYENSKGKAGPWGPMAKALIP